jgi:hypothetical protein
MFMQHTDKEEEGCRNVVMFLLCRVELIADIFGLIGV